MTCEAAGSDISVITVPEVRAKRQPADLRTVIPEERAGIRMEVQIETLIDQETLEKRVQEMAEELDRVYAGKELRMIGILKGSVYFLCELTKRMKTPVTLDFLSVSSYGNGTSATGVIHFNKDLDEPIEGQDVIVVEDIMDTGRTLSFLMDVLKERNPASLKVITLPRELVVRE